MEFLSGTTYTNQVRTCALEDKTNSGYAKISFGGANCNMDLCTDSTSRMYINAAGNIGIGTQSPEAKLSIVGDVSATGGLSAAAGHVGASYFGSCVGIGTNRPNVNAKLTVFRSNDQIRLEDGSLAYILGYDDSYFRLKNSAGDTQFVTNWSSGNVGIGTATPGAKLSVKGSMSATGGLSAAAVAGTSYFGGNVGIGTNHPGEALTVSGNISGNGNLYLGDNGQLNLGVNDLQLYHDGSTSYITNATGDMYFINSANNKDICFASDDGDGGYKPYFYLDGSAERTIFPDSMPLQLGGSASDGDLQLMHNGTDSYITNNVGDLYINQEVDDKDIIFQADDGSGGKEVYLMLDGSAGNVGIGTTGPSEKLSIMGNVSACGALSATGSNNYFGGNVGIGTTAPSQELTVRGEVATQNASGIQTVIVGNASDDGTVCLNNSGGVTKAVIHSDGDSYFNGGCVGIGETAPEEKLEVAGNILAKDGGVLAGINGDKDGFIFHDFYTAGGNFYGYKAFSSPGRLSVVTDGAERLTVHYEGNVGIGTTTPGTKLSIVGSVSATGGLSAAAVTGPSYFGGNVGIGTNRPDGALNLADSCQMRLGSGGAFRFYHNGTNNCIESHGGDIIVYNYDHGNDIAFCAENASGTAHEYLRIDSSAGNTCFSKEIRTGDGVQIQLGTGNDMQIQHNGANGFINNSTGSLYINPGSTAHLSGNLSATGSLSAIGSGVSYFGGNVGIGGAAETELHVCGTDPRIRVDSTANNHPGFEISEAGTRRWIMFNDPDNGDALTFKSGAVGAGNDRFAMNPAGDLKIGGGSGPSGYYGLEVGGTGNACFAGNIEKAGGSFSIIHPLPALSATKKLVHSFIEGPQADNIYSGVVQLTAGTADINIDNCANMTEGTFVGLNRCIRAFANNESTWDPVRARVSGNIVTVESCVLESTADVSWMVIGERQDAHMFNRLTTFTDNNGKVIVEPDRRPT